MGLATTQADQARGGRRRLVVAGSVLITSAAATAVLLLGSGAEDAAMATDANGVPAVIHESAQALQAGNYEAWRAVRSPDARLSDGHPVIPDSPLRHLVARHGELDLELNVLGCRETSASNSTIRSFECRIEGSEAIMRAADVQGQAQWTYLIQGGIIIESSPPFFDNGADIAQAHGALSRYLREVDRANFDQLCNAGHLDLFDAGLGPDCTAFIRGHLEGFAANDNVTAS